MAFTLEKKILTEILQIYKDEQCLWNTSHELYSNKVARNRANNILLEKYKILDSTADQKKMKKKVENMRTTYKRERSKIIKSQMAGGELYEPSLWYYKHLEFLDEMNDPNDDEKIVLHNDTSNVDEDGNDDERSHDLPPAAAPSPQPVKRPKPVGIYLSENDIEYNEVIKKPSSKKAKISGVYLTDENDYQEEPAYTIKEEPTDVYLGPSPDSDLFGKTIAVQLNELRPKQRFIAEKLISDVIFYGRLDKLKTGTSLNLNNDF